MPFVALKASSTLSQRSPNLYVIAALGLLPPEVKAHTTPGIAYGEFA